MPSYRNGNDEYRRKPPKMYYDKDEEPEKEYDDEEEEDFEEKKPFKKPVICKVEFPFKVLVKVIPCEDKHCCDEHKRQMPS